MIARRPGPARPQEPEEGDRGHYGCRQCGTPYRPPRWGREYLCGACGRPLQKPRRRRRSLPIPLMCLGLLVGLAALVVRMGADRIFAFASRPPAAEPEQARLALPPGTRERLLERLRWLELDLREEPGHPLLLSETARGYLYLAVLDRRDAEARARWEQAAGGALQRLRRISPEEEAPIEADLRDLDRLTWTQGTGDASLAVYRPWNAPITFPNGPGGFRRRFGVPNGPAPAAARRYVRPEFRGGNSPGSGPPGFGHNAANGPALILQPPPVRYTSHTEDERLDTLRQAFRAAPGGATADALGEELEQRATRENDRAKVPYGEICAAARALLLEAVQVYRQEGRTSRLRIHRAAFHKAAAAVCRRLHLAELEYRELAEAARSAPYAPQVWRELHVAALRTGRTRESRVARQRLTDWSLPALLHR